MMTDMLSVFNPMRESICWAEECNILIRVCKVVLELSWWSEIVRSASIFIQISKCSLLPLPAFCFRWTVLSSLARSKVCATYRKAAYEKNMNRGWSTNVLFASKSVALSNSTIDSFISLLTKIGTEKVEICSRVSDTISAASLCYWSRQTAKHAIMHSDYRLPQYQILFTPRVATAGLRWTTVNFMESSQLLKDPNGGTCCMTREIKSRSPSLVSYRRKSIRWVGLHDHVPCTPYFDMYGWVTLRPGMHKAGYSGWLSV